MMRYLEGEVLAYRELFARYAPLLLRVLRRYTTRAADAPDLVQQTFLQLHRARHDFKTGTRLRPWLLTIGLNIARDMHRRHARRPEVSIEDHTPVVASDDGDRDTRDVKVRVRDAVCGLPADQREVIELHWFHELTFNEIAAIVGSTAGAVRVRAHRGYVALRSQLRLGNTTPSTDV